MEPMGLFSVKVRIADLSGPAALGQELELLVDTDATYTTIPEDVLARHGVRRLGQIKVKLADGRWVAKDYGAAIVAVDGMTVGTTVLFGAPGDLPLLGATTLELASLAVDPVGKRLVPVQAIQA
jgi:predicted aspartyl protease